MLKKSERRAIIEKADQYIAKGFDKDRFEKPTLAAFEEAAEADATVLYVDIADFSTRVTNLAPKAILSFLDAFYAIAIKSIVAHDGEIDRVMGDGIIAIFSPFLNNALPNAKEAAWQAFLAAREIIVTCGKVDRVSKAAISCGKLLFCKSGILGAYQELTVIGTPLTEVYRLENIASADRILVPADSVLGEHIVDLLARGTIVVNPHRIDGRFFVNPAADKGREYGTWRVGVIDEELRGIGKKSILVHELCRGFDL